LSTKQLGALTYLLAAISILFCLFTIITIIYILLNYLKTEEKYPRLVRFLEYKGKKNILIILFTYKFSNYYYYIII
jgi:hypothetical protein